MDHGYLNTSRLFLASIVTLWELHCAVIACRFSSIVTVECWRSHMGMWYYVNPQFWTGGMVLALRDSVKWVLVRSKIRFYYYYYYFDMPDFPYSDVNMIIMWCLYEIGGVFMMMHWLTSMHWRTEWKKNQDMLGFYMGLLFAGQDYNHWAISFFIFHLVMTDHVGNTCAKH